ncbi:hypothetical protein [Clostridium celatum]|uniref:hypothetical protein n=1 Tax=Clostridium celatum TaxID=36834 RepID=UPI001898F24E|nr:hypothetical protein [Clostridium celatum]
MKYDESWVQAKCDKYDYMISVFSGAVSGIIDIFFVGAPGESTLCNFTDKQTDKLVKNFAKSVGWKPRDSNSENVKSAIGYLEKKFIINYDQAHTVDVGNAFKMTTKNHHFKSLGHSPDIVGLFFSVLDQFQGKSTFLNNGSLIRVNTDNNNFELKGSNFESKVFCGVCNWIGHIMSDCAGSSGAKGRGSGVAIPFMGLFQICNFGKFSVGKDRQTLAEIMTRVFQQGYDARFGAAMTIPVLINELIIRVLWVIKKHFYEMNEWKYCIPSEKNSDLRIMLLVGYGTLCLLDGADAAVRSGGNTVTFILRLNIIGWARLILLVFKELRIRYGDKVLYCSKLFLNEVGNLLSYEDNKLLNQYHERMYNFNKKLEVELNELMSKVNEEYNLLYGELELALNNQIELEERVKHTEIVAEICEVKEEEIIRNFDDLDKFFLE